MDLAILKCLNIIPKKYYCVFVRGKPLYKRAGSVLSVRSASRVRGSDPRFSKNQSPGQAGLTREFPVSRGSRHDPTRQRFVTLDPTRAGQ